MGWVGELLNLWFAPEVTGLENVPDGACLVVGMHNGGNLAPDMFATMVGVLAPLRPRATLVRPGARSGVPRADDRPLAAEARRGAGAPGARGGAAGARRDGAGLSRRRPRRVQAVARAPRGQVRRAHRLHPHRARAPRVPIVPVVSVGAHETFAVVTDGRRLARRHRPQAPARAWRCCRSSSACPGASGWAPSRGTCPLPSKVRDSRAPADPPRRLARRQPPMCRRPASEVRAAMQAAVDELVAEGGFGPLARLV